MNINLAALQLDYEAGVITHDTLAQKYGITKDKLIRIAAERNWTQREAPVPNHRYLTVIDVEEITDGIYQDKPVENMFSEDELAKRALLSSASVMQRHKADVDLLRQNTREIGESVMHNVRRAPKIDNNMTINEAGAAAKVQQILLTSFSNYAQAMQTQINLERKIYRLEDVVVNDAENNSLIDAQQKLLKDMKDELAKLQESKSAFTIPVTPTEKVTQ